MNNEQLRTDFEVWAKTHYYLSELGLEREDDEYVDMEVQGAFEAYQAGRAALQGSLDKTQDREDAARLDWIESIHGCEVIEFVDGTWEVDIPDGSYWIGKSMREAIDHARRVEEEQE